MKLSIGYSPCPNDCFTFYALAHGLIATGFEWEIQLEDVQQLNEWAQASLLDVSKVSYHAAFQLMGEYVLLRSGGALGHGVGPLIVTKRPLASLAGRRVATPGRMTTANLLLNLWLREEAEIVALRYDQIMPSVAEGSVDAGLIIHESRFTYERYGFYRLVDLGEWWEELTGLPLPLGGVIAKRSLGADRLRALNTAVRQSLEYALSHPDATAQYVAQHAQELSPEVRRSHIELYVTDYSRDIGDAGAEAANALLARAVERGLVKRPTKALFVSS